MDLLSYDRHACQLLRRALKGLQSSIEVEESFRLQHTDLIPGFCGKFSPGVIVDHLPKCSDGPIERRHGPLAGFAHPHERSSHAIRLQPFLLQRTGNTVFCRGDTRSGEWCTHRLVECAHGHIKCACTICAITKVEECCPLPVAKPIHAACSFERLFEVFPFEI